MNNHFIPSDQNTRDLAINQPNTNLSIEAGAGTGKTTLLARRYVNAILQHDIPMSACVAITFTEKAALELKQRIRALLHDQNQQQRAQEVYTAPISTIHAFCSKLLHQQAFAARLDPQFSQIDPLQQTGFLEDCFDVFLNQLLDQTKHDLSDTHASQVILRLNAYDIGIKKIKFLCLEAYQQREFFKGYALSKPTWPNVQNFIAALTASYEKLYHLAQHACTNKEDLAYVGLNKLYPWLKHLQSQNIAQQFTALLFEINISPSKGTQKNWENPKDLKYIKETLKHLKHQHQQLLDQLGHCIAQDTLLLLKAFVDFVAQEKQSKGLLDFDDLLSQTLTLLTNEPDSRRYFQNQYRCFFVDEFQDTDPVQKEIIWLLSNIHQSQTNSSTFIVGDPKQSIYRFRGASLETYAQATEDFKQHNQHLPIVQNFRSSKRILDWINLSFKHLLAQDYYPLEALPTHLGHEHSVVALDPLPDQQDLNAQQSKQAEARCIANYILSIINSDVPLVFDKQSQSYRKAMLNDIAIVYPASTGLDDLEEQLRTHQIDFLSQGGRSFFKRSEIEGLVYIMRAVSKPHDGIAMCSALKSCFLALDDHALLELFEKNNFSSLDIDNPDTWTSYTATSQASLRILHDCRQFMLGAQSYRISDVLYHIIEACYVYAVLALRKHYSQALANVKKLILLAQYFEQNISPYMDDFVQWCLSTQNSRHDLAEASIDTVDINAVHLMTMHKSKGLEFPIVILCQLSGKPMPYPSFLNHPHSHKKAFGFKHSEGNMYTHAYSSMLLDEKAALIQEKKRLLYVACTRAQDVLVISRFTSGDYKDSFHALMEPAWQKTENLFSVLTEEALQTEKQPSSSSQISPKNAIKSISETLPNTMDYAAQVNDFTDQQHLFKQRMQASHWQTPAAVNANTFPELIANAKKTHFGTLFHKLMQDLAEQKFDVSLINGMLNHHQVLDPTLRKQLHGLLEKSLLQPLLQRAKNAQLCIPEYPLLIQSCKGEIQPMFIDLLFKDNNHWILVDYKTDDLKKSSAQEKSNVYAEKIKSYAAHLKSQHSIPVHEAHILFVQTQQSIQINT